MLEGEGFVSAYCALTWRVAVADDELLLVLFCWLVVHYNCIRPLSFRLSVFFPFSSLNSSAIKCLTNARGLGTVIIITNAESGWVQVSY